MELKKLINLLNKNGKKILAIKIVNNLVEKLGYNLILESINNLKPYFDIKIIRIAGITYHIPYEINEKRQLFLALKWLIQSAQQRSEKNITLKLLGELVDAQKKQGNAFKKKEELHKLVNNNRAYTNYRWN